MGSLVRDLRRATRGLGRHTGLALTATATLGVGIGLSAAIFSVVNGLLLKPLPLPDADRLVLVREVDRAGQQLGVSEPNFADVEARSRSFSSLAHYAGSFSLVVTGGTEPVRARVTFISARFFDAAGVQPLIGRTFTVEETRYRGPSAALVSHGFWQRVLGATHNLDGVTLKIDGIPTAIVGVMPVGFSFPPDTEVWLTRSAEAPTPSRRAHGLAMLGRLRPDVTLARAQWELSASPGSFASRSASPPTPPTSRSSRRRRISRATSATGSGCC